jgi:hypothetical protein
MSGMEPDGSDFDPTRQEKTTAVSLPAPYPTSDETEVSDMAEAATEETNQHPASGSGLPFSKARCIALVATLSGASFLNVRRLYILSPHEPPSPSLFISFPATYHHHRP